MLKKRNGVTLIELVITLALVGLVLQVIYSVFFVGSTSFSISTNRGFSQQDVRLVGDFIVSELKYITNLTTSPDILEEHFMGDYYSLRITKVENNTVLVRTNHKYLNNEAFVYADRYTLIEDKNIKGNYETFRVTNNTKGSVNVFISQEEGIGNKKSRYALPLDIILVNNRLLLSNVDIDLMTDGTVIYYNKAKDTVMGKIDITGDAVDTGVSGETTITFNSQGGLSVTPITQNFGTEVNVPTPTKDGYIFSRWNTLADDTGTTFTAGSTISMPAVDLALYAIWIDNSPETTISAINVVNINNSNAEEQGNNGYKVTPDVSNEIELEIVGNNLDNITVTISSNESVGSTDSGNPGKVILNINAPSKNTTFTKEIIIKKDEVLLKKELVSFRTTN